MVGFREKFRGFKYKITGTPPQTPPPERASETASVSNTETAPSLPVSTDTSLPGLQERLRNQAYDELKTSESKAVDAYETILSNRLRLEESPENEIGKTPDVRCRQMQQLVQDGLESSRKEASIKQAIGEGLDVVQSVKEIVDNAIQAVPQAAIAWTGICICLEIISKPINEHRKNREGITYVVSRMNWYWNLARLLLDQNKTINSSPGLRDEMESRVIQLYKKLLLYQINSVCLYHRNQLIKIGRDLLSLDDWAGQLSDIESAERSVQEDAAQYSSEQIKEYMSKLLTTAVMEGEKLDGIFSAIQSQTQKQEQRFQNEKDQQCLKDLYETNPTEDKKRIQDTKGDLLRDSYSWILDHDDFKQFRNDPESRLLWIKGDPGKGKTMLMCGVIDELQKERDLVLSYFFCQATEAKLSNATSILRSLMYLLVIQQPSLLHHLREKYDITGEKLFLGANFWETLVEIFTAMLSDTNLKDAIFIIDALDECNVDRHKLLDFIAKSSDMYRAKWIVSGRNWVDIDQKLHKLKQTVGLHLELNQELISKAVDTYITYKVNQLARDKEYEEETRAAVEKHLTSNAQGTFLWVALVCKELADPMTLGWHTLGILTSFPPGLGPLYERMMHKIQNSSDASRCKEILAIVSAVYRPITLQELKVLSKSLETFTLKDLKTIIICCGSFLTFRHDTILFVHQSAKDYLLEKASNQILPFGIADQHHDIFLRSLKALSQTLTRDIYGLGVPGVLIDDISPPHLDPLASIGYASVYWVDHLRDSKSTEIYHDRNIQDSTIIYEFMKNKFLHWLESLSLLHYVPEGITALLKLEDITRTFFRMHTALSFLKQLIKTAPLQVYVSALIFSPTGSLVKQLFESETPEWITLKFPIKADWDECLQILEGHSGNIKSVTFSHDSRLVASSSQDETVRIWSADTGECLHTLEEREDSTSSVAFSHDSRLVVSASRDIHVWRADTGECIQTIEDNRSPVYSVTFSHDSKFIASGSEDGSIWIWRTDTGEYIQILEGHNDGVASVTFSHDSKLIVSASYDTTIRIWRADIGEWIRTLNGHRHRVFSAAVSHDSQLIASASQDKTIRIWRTDTGECIRTLDGHTDVVWSVAFSHDSQLIASAASDQTMRVWSADTGECVQMHRTEMGSTTSVAFSHDSRRIASASNDARIRIWRVNIYQRLQATLRVDSGWVGAIAISRNSELVATAEWPKPIRIWHVDTGKCIQTIDEYYSHGGTSSFEENDTLLKAGPNSYAILNTMPSIRSSADLPPPSPARLPAYHAAYGLKDGWVTLDGEKMLRLPAEEFYINCWEASDSVIAIGCMSGVIILRRS